MGLTDERHQPTNTQTLLFSDTPETADEIWRIEFEIDIAFQQRDFELPAFVHGS
jgi:hypothetical protein